MLYVILHHIQKKTIITIYMPNVNIGALYKKKINSYSANFSIPFHSELY